MLRGYHGTAEDESQQSEAGTVHRLSQQLCCAVVGFPTLSVQTAVGVDFVLNYSAHNQRGAAWKRMSLCLGVADTKAGKHLLDHLALV